MTNSYNTSYIEGCKNTKNAENKRYMWDIVPTYKIYSFPKYPSKVKVDKNKCRIPIC